MKNHTRSLSTILIATIALLGPTTLTAQQTKEGYALTWNNTIVVAPDSLKSNGRLFPAYTFTVFESDANTALGYWKSDMKAQGSQVSGSKPMKATGVRQAKLSTDPILMMAMATTDKKAGSARMTVAFALNDSTPIAESKAAMDLAREMSVRYNRAVVQEQITNKEGQHDDVHEDLSDARADSTKLNAKATKARMDMENAQSKQKAIKADNEDIAVRIAGAEKKFAITNDHKDLQKLTKLRNKLAKGESKLSKEIQAENKSRSTMKKYEADMPKTSREMKEHGSKKEKASTELDDLKRKLDKIE
jgi:chromosome segregation ATPase